MVPFHEGRLSFQRPHQQHCNLNFIVRLVVKLRENMRLLFILLLTLSLFQSVHAQIDWGHRIGDPDRAWVTRHVVDREGNIVVIGGFTGSITIGSFRLSNSDTDPTFIYKSTPKGKVLWAKTLSGIRGTGTFGLSTGGDEGIYITSNFTRELVIDGTSLLAGGSGYNAFLCKLDSGGNLEWVKGVLTHVAGGSRVMHASSSNAKGESVMGLIYYGSVTVGNQMIGNIGEFRSHLLITKYSPDGILDWYAQPPASSYAEALATKIDDSGNVYVSGLYNGTITFGSTTLTATTPGYSDVYLAKYDNKGNALWAKGFNKITSGELSNMGKALDIDPATGDVFLAGDFKGSVDFDGVRLDGVNTKEIGAIADIFLTRITDGGKLVWARQMGSKDYDLVDGLHLRNDQVVLSGVWDYNPFLRSYDLEGNVLSEFTMELGRIGFHKSHGVAHSVSVVDNNSYILSGFYSGAYQLGSNDWTSSNGSGFLIKVNRCLDGSLPPMPALSLSCKDITIANHVDDFKIVWFKDGLELVLETTPTLANPQKGRYVAGFKNACGITYSDTVTFNGVIEAPPVPEITSDCRKIVVKNQVSSQISWFLNGLPLTGELGAELLLQGSGEYRVQFMNDCGTSSASISIDSYTPAQGYTFYNIFTPNGDGKNDAFEVEPALVGSSLQVFNRWGQKVFESKDYQNNWKGDGLSPAVYFWFLSNKCAGDLRGTVTIIR